MLEELITLFSKLQKTDHEVIAGIDEAGRGPVIGPMVYAIYVGSVKDQIELDKQSDIIKDSKMMTPNTREKNFYFMKDYAYVSVDPMYIATHMEGKSKTLNNIAYEAVKMLLNELKNKHSNVKCVYIDGLGNNETYKTYLKKSFNYEFVVENKADERYSIVSKASIVAKVVRDKLVSTLECGSGYPSDEVTINWMKKNIDKFFGFPNYVRYSWKTTKNLLPLKNSDKLKGLYSNFYIGKE